MMTSRPHRFEATDGVRTMTGSVGEIICPCTGERKARIRGEDVVQNRHANSISFKGGLSRSQKRRAMVFLKANINKTITINEIAAECGLSSSHFSRAFRESTGKPPHRWLIEYRVALARELLLKSDLALAEIANDCGFSDQSHLTRRFANISGLPPGTWRRWYRD
jgi:AraC-like DNA-binding protein